MTGLLVGLLVGLLMGLSTTAFVGGPAAASSPPASPAPNSTLPPSTPEMQVIPLTPYYSGGPTFDAYLPRDGRSRHPALIMVHGGGWQGGDKATYAPFAVRAVTDEHWAAFAVNYRLDKTDKAAWPDELHDVQAAIRFIVAHASTYDIDPAQVMILGGSAGANLVALVSEVGTADPITGHPVGANPNLVVPINAVALWSPPVDLADLVGSAGKPPAECGSDEACDFIWSTPFIVDYLGCPPTECPQTYSDASPINRVSPRTASSFVVASTNEIVPIDQVRAYVDALKQDDVTVELDELPGELHSSQYGDEVWSPTVGFLGSHLAESGLPSSSGSNAGRAADDLAIAAVAFAVGLVVLAVLYAVLRRRRRSAGS